MKSQIQMTQMISFHSQHPWVSCFEIPICLEMRTMMYFFLDCIQKLFSESTIRCLEEAPDCMYNYEPFHSGFRTCDGKESCVGNPLELIYVCIRMFLVCIANS